MTRKYWLLLTPLVLLIGAGGWKVVSPSPPHDAEGRFIDTQFLDLERSEGYHLYAPTWLPRSGTIGIRGAIRGVNRVVEDFDDGDGRSMLIMAQERRTPDRDRYHQAVFVHEADAEVDLNGARGYFITGKDGARRLFWQEGDRSLIVSSCGLTDQEMAQIARKVR